MLYSPCLQTHSCYTVLKKKTVHNVEWQSPPPTSISSLLHLSMHDLHIGPRHVQIMTVIINNLDLYYISNTVFPTHIWKRILVMRICRKFLPLEWVFTPHNLTRSGVLLHDPLIGLKNVEILTKMKNYLDNF